MKPAQVCAWKCPGGLFIGDNRRDVRKECRVFTCGCEFEFSECLLSGEKGSDIWHTRE